MVMGALLSLWASFPCMWHMGSLIKNQAHPSINQGLKGVRAII